MRVQPRRIETRVQTTVNRRNKISLAGGRYSIRDDGVRWRADKSERRDKLSLARSFARVARGSRL